MNNEYIKFIRFENTNQTSGPSNEYLKFQIQSTKRSLLSHSLRVTHDTVPSIHHQINICADILNMKIDQIEAYIYSEPDHNAFSISESNSMILIAISSSLIKILDDIELRFLIGHELGHAIFKHSEFTHSSKDGLEYELIKRLRNMEISADRIGYICSMSLDKSITAMMKIASGLEKEFLNVDIRPFIDQSLDLGKELNRNVYESSSHPPLPLRARALVWLSTMRLFENDELVTFLTNQHYETISSINNQINQNIRKLLDLNMDKRFESSKKFLGLLLATLQFSEDGILSKNEQKQLVTSYGQDAQKLFRLISGLSRKQVIDMLLSKLKETFNEMLSYSREQSHIYFQEYSKNIGIGQKRISEISSIITK